MQLYIHIRAYICVKCLAVEIVVQRLGLCNRICIIIYTCIHMYTHTRTHTYIHTYSHYNSHYLRFFELLENALHNYAIGMCQMHTGVLAFKRPSNTHTHTRTPIPQSGRRSVINQLHTNTLTFIYLFIFVFVSLSFVCYSGLALRRRRRQ